MASFAHKMVKKGLPQKGPLLSRVAPTFWFDEAQEQKISGNSRLASAQIEKKSSDL
jgi:hypothetical protein